MSIFGLADRRARRSWLGGRRDNLRLRGEDGVVDAGIAREQRHIHELAVGHELVGLDHEGQGVREAAAARNKLVFNWPSLTIWLA